MCRTLIHVRLTLMCVRLVVAGLYSVSDSKFTSYTSQGDGNRVYVYVDNVKRYEDAPIHKDQDTEVDFNCDLGYLTKGQKVRPISNDSIASLFFWRKILTRDVFCYRIPAPLVPGVPTKTRLESSTNKCNRENIYYSGDGYHWCQW